MEMLRLYFQPGTLEMGQNCWGGDRNAAEAEGMTPAAGEGLTRGAGLSRNDLPVVLRVLQPKGGVLGSLVGDAGIW